MRKLFLVTILSLVVSLPAMALSLDDITKNLPDLKQGIGYSFLDNDIHYLTTAQLWQHKKFTFEAGFSFKKFANTESDTPDMPIVVVGYNLFNFKDMGIDIPYLKEVNANLGIYAGCNKIAITDTSGNNEFDWGASLTLLDFKF